MGTVLASMCLMGCGGDQSCETLACGTLDIEGGSGFGISIPGCGGCLSSGSGCDSCLWGQSHKIACVTQEYEGETNKYLGCDNRYFGDGCLGCGQSEKTAYIGCISLQGSDDKVSGCVYGGSDQKEHAIGCVNGCGGCIGTGGVGFDFIHSVEQEMGID